MSSAIKDSICILSYTSEHYNFFRQLNYDWITRYFHVEEADHHALDDPDQYILGKGGFIFMATYQHEIVGTCALIKTGPFVFELAKMAVSEKVQGKGIGYALGMACIEQARAAGAKKVELLSNTILQPAIYLYKKLGFTEVPLPVTEYERANIKMELAIGNWQ